MIKKKVAKTLLSDITPYLGATVPSLSFHSSVSSCPLMEGGMYSKQTFDPCAPRSKPSGPKSPSKARRKPSVERIWHFL